MALATVVPYTCCRAQCLPLHARRSQCCSLAEVLSTAVCSQVTTYDRLSRVLRQTVEEKVSSEDFKWAPCAPSYFNFVVILVGIMVPKYQHLATLGVSVYERCIESVEPGTASSASPSIHA